MPINDITGLYESYNHDLSVAVVKQKSGRTLRLNGQARAIHDIPTSRGVLSAFANLARADILLVVLSDDFSKAQPNSQSLAARILRASGKKSAFLVTENISQIVSSRDKQAVVITDEIYNTVLNLAVKASSKSGAKRIIFMGEGRNANLALVLSSTFDGSYVLAIDPVYNLKIDLSEVQRFNKIFAQETTLRSFYSKLAPTNRIQVMQNLKKIESNMSEYLEFKDLFFIGGIDGTDFTSRKIFRIYNPKLMDIESDSFIIDAATNPTKIIELFNQGKSTSEGTL